ncbi:MAG TPA: LysE family translocator [Thermomicrobiales bacterium]|nr:LysE family translocator [Thermomicrobiales bacterium]
MPSGTHLGLFLAAALVLAVSPGPGLLYVLARSLRGGRRAGLASSGGTALGGLGHVVAAAFGLSAILAASALAFGVVKYVGAAYLIVLGLRTLFSQEDAHPAAPLAGDARRAFRQGVVTEALNPKTALFFLAFLPQFVDPAAPAVPQFLLLGAISVALNSGADVVVALLAGPIGGRLWASARRRRGQRLVAGGVLIGLGAYVAVAGGEH